MTRSSNGRCSWSLDHLKPSRSLQKILLPSHRVCDIHSPHWLGQTCLANERRAKRASYAFGNPNLPIILLIRWGYVWVPQYTLIHVWIKSRYSRVHEPSCGRPSCRIGALCHLHHVPCLSLGQPDNHESQGWNFQTSIFPHQVVQRLT